MRPPHLENCAVVRTAIGHAHEFDRVGSSYIGAMRTTAIHFEELRIQTRVHAREMLH